ncbi:hypothetical protein BSKO_05484 [Bryopsis sp. KO-2023]|nr:hypothetical protein BSKO_05484 [Bryopsis sp. KO-2023]
MSTKGRSCGCKGQGSRKSRERFYNSEDFMVNCFKVLPCFKKYRHDWWVCPYAHEGETAKRRDPKKFKYVGVACPDAKQGKACPRGDECPCTHNVFEYWLHPTRFRTAFCGRGIHCTRPFCFFAHSLSEMRKPSLEDLLPVIEGDSLFNEEMLKAALEDHKRDVARLGGKDTCLELLDMSFLQAPCTGAPTAEDGSTYNISPRDGSPGGMSPYNSPTASPRDLSPGSLPMNHVPNMQSPRGVVSFMNAILRGVDPNDMSSQKLQYGIHSEPAQMVSPRDLSPVGTHGIGDGLPGMMRSPRGFSPVVSRGSTGGIPSPRGLSPTAMQGFDQEALVGALQALRDYGHTSPQMQPMYGGGHDVSGMHTSPRMGLSPSPRGRAAGYDLSSRDNSPQPSPPPQAGRILQHSASARERSSHGGLYGGYQSAGVSERARSNSPGIRGMDEHSIAAVREVLAALENSGMNGGALPHQPNQFHADHLGMDSILGGMSSERRSPPLREMAADVSMPLVDPENGGGIPESVQAVLRSLAQEELTTGGDDINRPFSSLSQLW